MSDLTSKPGMLCSLTWMQLCHTIFPCVMVNTDCITSHRSKIIPLCICFEVDAPFSSLSSSEESVDSAFRLLGAVVEVVVAGEIAVLHVAACTHQWEDSSKFAALSVLVTFADGAGKRLERCSSSLVPVSGPI